ncbi:MAG: cell division protein ZapA [Bacteroidales bacterium]|nr:cell division protein ZapA [Bacteroidales bacterium]
MSETNETNKGRNVTFEILGKKYSLTVRDEWESALRRAAKRLSERVGQFAQTSQGTKLASEDLLVYAAVEIIATCFEEKDNNQEAQITSSLVSLEQRLDEILQSVE